MCCFPKIDKDLITNKLLCLNKQCGYLVPELTHRWGTLQRIRRNWSHKCRSGEVKKQNQPTFWLPKSDCSTRDMPLISTTSDPNKDESQLAFSPHTQSWLFSARLCVSHRRVLWITLKTDCNRNKRPYQVREWYIESQQERSCTHQQSVNQAKVWRTIITQEW